MSANPDPDDAVMDARIVAQHTTTGIDIGAVSLSVPLAEHQDRFPRPHSESRDTRSKIKNHDTERSKNHAVKQSKSHRGLEECGGVLHRPTSPKGGGNESRTTLADGAHHGAAYRGAGRAAAWRPCHAEGVLAGAHQFAPAGARGGPTAPGGVRL